MKRTQQHVPVVIDHKKSTPQVCDLYKLQSIDIDATQECLRCFKETGCFQKKRNSSYIRKVKCYNCNIKRHYTWDCYKVKKPQTLATQAQPNKDLKI